MLLEVGKMLRRVALCLVLTGAILLMTSAAAFAADWYVDASTGSDSASGTSPDSAFKSITKGVQAAAPSDIVHVAAGLYAVATTGETFPIAMFDGGLQGAGSGLTTILGDNVHPVIGATGLGAGAKVDGFTISGGSPGLDLVGSALTVSNNVVTGNHGGVTGGGIHAEGGSATILDNVIRENTATYGGGIVSEFSDSSVIQGNTIEQNIAEEAGGGIECYYNATPTIVGNVISGNSAGLGAGITSESGSLPSVSETIISDNAADPTAGGKGGAILCYSGSVLLSNCLIVGNSASDYAISGLNSAATKIVNCTIADNLSAGVGRYSTSWSFSVEIRNSILRNQGLEIDAGTVANVTYSDIEGGRAGTGNIDSDPLFATPGGDYHLGATSPCIDAGAEEQAATVDLERNVRPSGAGWDMGSYEYVATSDTTPPDITVPADITAIATGPWGTVVEFTASAYDAVDGAIPTVTSASSGSTFPIGDTIVTVSAQDSAGNTAQATFLVAVRYGLTPISPAEDGSSVYRIGSTVPVQLKLSHDATSPISNALATCTVYRGDVVRLESIPFAYLSSKKGDIYNASFSTKGWSAGLYTAVIELGDGSAPHELVFTLGK